MQTIHKYQLTDTEVVLQIGQRTRAGVDLLSAGLDPVGALCVWARVDTTMPLTSVKFQVIGTGQDTASTLNATFLGTVLAGSYVWHVFYQAL